jgi:hypothetical protein
MRNVYKILVGRPQKKRSFGKFGVYGKINTLMDLGGRGCEIGDWIQGVQLLALSPWNRIPLEKLTVAQLVKNFASFYATRSFITVSTRACHWSQS